jgi:hypothetical protein
VGVAIIDQLPGDPDAGLIGEAAWPTRTGVDNDGFLTAFATDHEEAIVG